SSAPVTYAAAQIRDVSRRAASALSGKHDDPERTQATAAVKEVFDIAARIAGLADADVVWVSDSEFRGRAVWVAPLNVSGLLRSEVFGETPTVLTSATLVLGGDFSSFAGSVGLSRSDEVADDVAPDELEPLSWRGLD